MRPRIGVSSCLLAEETRSNGGTARPRFLTEELGAYVDWVPYPADVETGLGALWETWRLTGQGRLMEHGRVYPAISGLPAPAALDGYVAKGDPRGVQGGPWYPVDGQGVFERRLAAAFPLLPVAGDDVLAHAVPRARFVERVFARARLRELFTGQWRPRDLVAFHTRHKLQILAHSPASYQQAGRVVAAAGNRPRGDTETDYRQIFTEALASDATRGRTANAMHRAFRKISKRLDDGPRHDLLDRIRAYERGELPFDEAIRLLESHATGNRLLWAAEQTYLNPFPAGLRQRLWTPDGGTSPARS
jgi:uncharacterized protein YbgA (DUF1722 family)